MKVIYTQIENSVTTRVLELLQLNLNNLKAITAATLKTEKIRLWLLKKLYYLRRIFY